ncbi:MAG: outer membrane beta-barrel domain-containing protein [Myxococcaceae bacterium]
MTSLRSASLLAVLALQLSGVGAAFANAPTDSAPAAVSQAKPSASSDDDEDDPAPGANTPTPTNTGTPNGTTGTKTEPKKDAPTAAPAATPADANPDAQKLVSGAPLYNPNVAVHIVEKKAFSDAGKFEIVLFPAAMQVNGKFTQHFGTMGSIVYHLQENFGLQITGGYNWFNVESAFNGELVEKFRVEAQAATSLLWTWGVLGGVEVAPLYGKFALFDGTLAHFSFVINGGMGAGGTRHQLKPETTSSDGTVSQATYGDTGVRFMAGLGAGFRLRLGERFAFRLEVRDVVYAARMERVNGCNVDDLRAMDAKIRGGGDPASATVGPTCQVEKFTGTIEGTNIKRSNDVPLALNLVRIPSSDVLNNVGLYLGISFLF